MKNIFIILTLTLLLNISCKDNRVEIDQEKSIDPKLENFLSRNNSYLIDTSIINEIYYIRLETKEDCLISNIDKLLIDDQYIYISDLMLGKSVFVFNKTGEFIYKIDKYGRGPGEYLEPLAFNINSNGDVYIYDNSNKRILKYSNFGKEYEVFKTKIRFKDFIVLNNETIIVCNVFDTDGISSSLGKYNFKNNSFKKMIPSILYDELKLRLVSFTSSYFYKSSDTTYYWPRFTNIIYKLHENKTSEFIKFNESLIPPKEFVHEITREGLRNLSSNKYIFDIQSIYETSQLITLTYRNSNSPKVLIISKKTGTIKQISISSDKKYLGENRIHGVDGDFLISFIPPYKYSEKNWNKSIMQSSLSDTTKTNLLSLHSSSNPTIIFLRLKDF